MARKNKRGRKADDPIIAVVLLALLLLISFSLISGYMGGWGFGYMGGMMFFGPVFMVLIIVLVVWLVVSLTQDRR